MGPVSPSRRGVLRQKQGRTPASLHPCPQAAGTKDASLSLSFSALPSSKKVACRGEKTTDATLRFPISLGSLFFISGSKINWIMCVCVCKVKGGGKLLKKIQLYLACFFLRL